MAASAEPVGTLDVALVHARRLLARDLVSAAEQAAEILRVVPEQPMATLILGIARRELGDTSGALKALAPLVARAPSWAAAHYELGIALGAAGRGEDAIAALARAVAIAPALPDAWRALADHRSAVGDDAGADAAYLKHIEHSTRDPLLLQAAAALNANDLPTAEAILRPHLLRKPTDVPAIRMLAEIAARLSRYGDAEKLLTRCLELAPSFTPARLQLAFVLHRANKSSAALAQIERLLANDPRNPAGRNLKAGILIRLGDAREAVELYGGVVAEYGGQPKLWMSYGHALKSTGRPGGSDPRLPARPRARTASRRGVVQPRQPEDFPLHRCRRRRDAASVGARGARARGSIPPRVRARQGEGGRAATSRRPSSTTRKAMRCAAV